MKIGHRLEMAHAWLLWVPPVCTVLGAALNTFAVAANHGQMPVLMAPLTMLNPADFMHTPMGPQTHIKFLTDWIALNSSGKIYSPGDMFERLGDFCAPLFLGAWCALHCKVKHDDDYTNQW